MDNEGVFWMFLFILQGLFLSTLDFQKNLWRGSAAGLLLESMFLMMVFYGASVRHIGITALVQHVLGSCQSPCC